MTFEVDMTEVAQLAKDLFDAPAKAVPVIRKVTQAEARKVKSRAQAAAPRDRPWLAQQGIKQKSFTNEDNIATNVFTVPDPEGRDVGFYVEYGTSKMPPQPFMEPALAPAETSYPDAVLAAVDPFMPGPVGDVSGGDE